MPRGLRPLSIQVLACLLHFTLASLLTKTSPFKSTNMHTIYREQEATHCNTIYDKEHYYIYISHANINIAMPSISAHTNIYILGYHLYLYNLLKISDT